MMLHPIRVVIFDVGGVLTAETDAALREDIQRTLGIPPQLFSECWPGLTDLFGRGIITEEEFWEQMVAAGRAANPLPAESLLMREFLRGFQRNEEVFGLVERLRAANYRTAILSNTIAPHAAYHQEHGTYTGFDPVILSHQVRMRKPAANIFAHALTTLGVQPAEAVLVDDLKNNILGARANGMHAIFFQNAAQLEVGLQKLGLVF